MEMQDITQQTNTNSNTTNPQLENAISKSIEYKEKQVQEQKKKFFQRLKIMILAFLLLIFITVIVINVSKIFVKTKPVYVAVEVPKNQDTEPITPVVDKTNERSIYKSDLFKLTIKYPSLATIIEKEIDGSNPQKLEIVYSQKVSDNTVPVSEDTIQEGYIFRITLLDIPNRTLDEVTQIKKEAYAAKCPNTATISDPEKVTVDNIEGRLLKIQNCNADYKVYIIPRFGIYYELMQLFDGDIGIRQKYERITDETLLSLDFYLSDEEIVIDEPFKTFLDPKLKFSFRYPNYDDKCCKMEVPFNEQGYKQFLVLGKKDKTPGSDKVDIIGVFSRTYDVYKQKLLFSEWYTKQKELLLSEYKVATGNNPTTTEEEFDLGETGKKGYVLKGYSWRGYEYVFIDAGNNNAIIFVIDNKTGDQFKNEVSEIINSIKFF